MLLLVCPVALSQGNFCKVKSPPKEELVFYCAMSIFQPRLCVGMSHVRECTSCFEL